MTTPKLLQVGSETLKSVLSLLNYSSVNSINEDVNKVQEWMKGQPHLPEIMDAKKIQNFLILNKGSVETTKQKIDNYYTIRSKLPDVFEQINPKLPYFEVVLNTSYIVYLPKLTKDMYRVFVLPVRDKTLLETINPMDTFRTGLNLQELRLNEDVLYGDVVICDGKDLPFRYIAKVTPAMLSKALFIYKNVFSNRLKALYIINAPSFMEKIMFLIKMVLTPKLQDRVHIHQDSSCLIEHFGKEMIPRDYGGEEKSLAELQNILLEEVRQNGEYFDRLDELRVDEKLRPEKLTDDELLGCYGNFKKLEID